MLRLTHLYVSTNVSSIHLHKAAITTAEHSPEKNDDEKERLAKMGVEVDGGYVPP